MTVLLTIDEKNIQDVINFYYNTTMDILKTGKIHSKIIAEFPDISKKMYSFVAKEILSMKGKKIPVDYSLRLSSKNSKFVKIAQGPLLPAEMAALAEMAEGLTAAEGSGLLETFKGVAGKFDLIQKTLDTGKKLVKGAIKEAQDVQLLKDILLLFTSVEVAKGKERFSPSTYEFLLEGKGPRGIDNSYVSKGAYDLPSKSIYEDYERSKREHPEMFEKRFDYQDAPEFEPFRKKPTIFFDDTNKSGEKSKPDMKFQPIFKKIQNTDKKDTDKKDISASTNNNIRTAQDKVPLITEDEYNQISELYPKWSFNDLNNEIRKVSADETLSDEVKQQQYSSIIAKYAKNIEPLHKYLQGMTKEK
jgi:hypothetical protein